MNQEPILTAIDERIWRTLRRAATSHARTALHARRVSKSIELLETFASRVIRPYAGWSAGKDSTAMTHLICQQLGYDWRVLSIKDDLDYPGEEEYVTKYAHEWKVKLDIVHPSFSLQEWLIEHRDVISADEEMHARASAFSDAAFYSLIEEYADEHKADGVVLGLRSSESSGRAMNRAKRGAIYKHSDGRLRCLPIVDWSDMDVYAYLFANDIEPFTVYRCVGLHEKPGKVRKSWWLPGASSATGGIVWLRQYYPSLYRRLTELLPDASRLR